MIPLLFKFYVFKASQKSPLTNCFQVFIVDDLTHIKFKDTVIAKKPYLFFDGKLEKI